MHAVDTRPAVSEDLAVVATGLVQEIREVRNPVEDSIHGDESGELPDLTTAPREPVRLDRHGPERVADDVAAPIGLVALGLRE